MPTYVNLVNYTADGIANMKDSPSRLDAAREVCSSHGGELTQFYLTLGRYDAVAITEFPDDASATQAMISIAGGGAVRTETLSAFTEPEYRDLVEGL